MDWEFDWALMSAWRLTWGTHRDWLVFAWIGPLYVSFYRART